MQNLCIIGAGKFGREVFTWAEQAIKSGIKWKIKGFIDQKPNEGVNETWAHKLIIANLDEYEPEKDDVFLIGIGQPEIRERIGQSVEKKNGKFGSLIHPSSVIGSKVRVGTGNIIGPFVQIPCDVEIGSHVFIGPQTSLSHDNKIGDYCQISGCCAIAGNVEIGKRVFIAPGTVIVPGKQIGDDSYVGAGSVVLTNIKCNGKVFGNPAIQIN